jgi:hypothetical protein
MCDVLIEKERMSSEVANNKGSSKTHFPSIVATRLSDSRLANVVESSTVP